VIINFSGELIDFFEKTLKGGYAHAICPSCGLEFENYIETGKLGCSVCYDVFREQIARQIAEWK
jgi:protein-arginine kinase activator protein McsA